MRIIHACMIVAIGLTLVIPSSNPIQAAITYTPTRYEFDVDPGQIISDSLKIFNTEDTEQSYRIEILHFTARDDESGWPLIYEPGDTQYEDGRGISEWVRINQDPFAIPGKGMRFIPFEIHVPETAVGSYFGAVAVEQLNNTVLGNFEGEVSSQVKVVGKSGPLVLVNVRGDHLGEELNLLRFFRDRRLYSSLPVIFKTTFENNGITYLKPLGDIVVRNWRGKEKARVVFNKSDGNILPGTSRTLDSTWQKVELNSDTLEIVKEIRNFALGKYKATLDVRYKTDAGTQTVEATQTFWVIPWQLLLIFLAVLIVLRFIIKRYNAAVVKSAQKRSVRR